MRSRAPLGVPCPPSMSIASAAAHAADAWRDGRMMRYNADRPRNHRRHLPPCIPPSPRPEATPPGSSTYSRVASATARPGAPRNHERAAKEGSTARPHLSSVPGAARRRTPRAPPAIPAARPRELHRKIAGRSSSVAGEGHPRPRPRIDCPVSWQQSAAEVTTADQRVPRRIVA